MTSKIGTLLTRRLILSIVVTLVILALAGYGVLLPALQDPGSIPSMDGLTPAETTRTPTTNNTTTDAATSLDVSMVAPVRVISSNGSISSVEGTLAGTFEWSGLDGQSVQLTVRSRVPGEGWETVDQTTVSLQGRNGSVRVSDLFDRNLTLATGQRAREFVRALESRSSGSPVALQIRSSVSGAQTAADESTAVRTMQVVGTDEYSPDSGTESYEAATEGPILVLAGGTPEPTVFEAAGIAPDSTGSGSIAVSNVGDQSGTLSIALNYTGSENGWTEPESEVDDDRGPTDRGELLDGLYLRAAVLRDDGSTDYLLGDAETFVALDQIEQGEAHGSATLDAGSNGTLVVQWKLAHWVGNEAQSDSASIDLDVQLTSDSQGNQASITDLVDSVLGTLAFTHHPPHSHVGKSISLWQPHDSSQSDKPQVYAGTQWAGVGG